MNLLFTTFVIMALCSTHATANSIHENIGKIYKSTPDLKNFKRHHGSVNCGLVVYLGSQDIANLETELHLYFVKSKVEKIVMILGPGGIDSNNCLKRYHEVVSVLNKKYGKYRHQHVVSDTMIDDLVIMTKCAPIRNQLYKISNTWSAKETNITTTLVADDFGFYIEIEYMLRGYIQKTRKDLTKIL